MSLRGPITRDDIDTHILQPSTNIGQFITLNGKYVVLNNNILQTAEGFCQNDNNTGMSRKCEILLNEDYVWAEKRFLLTNNNNKSGGT